MPYCRKCGNELPEEAIYCPVCGTPVTSESAPSAPAAPTVTTMPELKLAFWWERFVAWLIDAAIVAVALLIFGFFTLLAGQPLGAFTSYGFSTCTALVFWIILRSLVL